MDNANVQNVDSTDLLQFSEPDNGAPAETPKRKGGWPKGVKREGNKGKAIKEGSKESSRPAIVMSAEEIAQMQGLVTAGIGLIWRGLTELLAGWLKEPGWKSDAAETAELAPYFKATLDIVLPAAFTSPYAPLLLGLAGYVGKRSSLLFKGGPVELTLVQHEQKEV